MIFVDPNKENKNSFDIPLNLPPLPILVVDDEPDILKAIERDLRGICEVITCTDPQLALKKIAEQEFFLVVSDLKMPEMSGIEFLEKVAKTKPQTQRLCLTAFVDLMEAAPSINRARLHQIITKPWEKSDLHEAIFNARGQYDLHRENIILREQALSDGLTGLANQRYFWSRLSSEISRAKRFGRPLSLVLCDADNFKKINDEFGHPAGDKTLKGIAQILESGRRSTDLAARYGGEEFALILPEAQADQARDIAQRILSQLKHSKLTTLSFGIATFPDHGQTPQSLVEAADQALLQAKKQGKACIVVSETT